MKAHAYVFAGPSLGIFLNGEAESGGETQDADSVKTFNLSGDVGVGGSYQLQEFIYLNADVRYSMGFLNAVDASDAGSWKNRDIRFQLCVLFHLLK
jgi:outer membrane protein W